MTPDSHSLRYDDEDDAPRDPQWRPDGDAVVALDLDGVCNDDAFIRADLARATGLTESSISRWRRGQSLPSRLAAVVIERRHNIHRSAWERLRSRRAAA